LVHIPQIGESSENTLQEKMLEIFIETNRSNQQLAIAITTLIESIVLLAILACQPNDTKQYPVFTSNAWPYLDTACGCVFQVFQINF